MNKYRAWSNRPTTTVDAKGLYVDPDRITSVDGALERLREAQQWLDSLQTAMRLAYSTAGLGNAKATQRAIKSVFDFMAKDPTLVAMAAKAIRVNPGFKSHGGNAFVFTCVCGWIDMGHFFFYASIARLLRRLGVEKHVAAGLSTLLSAAGEESQGRGPQGWRESYYTFEDLPSNLLGAAFGANLGDDMTGAEIDAAFKKLLKKCGAIDPSDKKAPSGRTVREVLRDEATELMDTRPENQRVAGQDKVPARNFTLNPYYGKAHDELCCEVDKENPNAKNPQARRRQHDKEFTELVKSMTGLRSFFPWDLLGLRGPAKAP